MGLVALELILAVDAGESASVSRLLSECARDEAAQLLCEATHSLAVQVRRPSSRAELVLTRASCLHLAVAHGFTSMLGYLLEFRAAIEHSAVVEDISSGRTASESTPLQLAAMLNRLEHVQMLLEAGALVDASNSDGETALWQNSVEGDLRVTSLLLSAGASVNCSNSNLTTCLMIAAYNGRAQLVRQFVGKGAATATRDENGRDVVLYAVSGGDLETVVYLVKELALKCTVDNEGVTVVMEAARCGHSSVLFWLLEYGCSKDVSDLRRRTPLHFSAQHPGDAGPAEILLDSGARLTKTAAGETVLMTAALHGHLHLLSLLLERREELQIDLNETDEKGRNVLFYVVSGGNVSTFSNFLRLGVPVRSSVDGLTLLMQAVSKRKLDIARFLLANLSSLGLRLDARDVDGWDALMFGAGCSHVGMFRLLVEHGAVTSSADDGRTVLMQAAAEHDKPLLRHLVDCRHALHVLVNARDRDGRNALFYVVQGGDDPTVLQILVDAGVRWSRAEHGTSVLMEACRRGRDRSVGWIVNNHGALQVDVNEVDDSGATCVHHATASGHHRLFPVLLRAGCDVRGDSKAASLLMRAAENGRFETVRALLDADGDVLPSSDVWARDTDGATLLHYCVRGGSLALLRLAVGHLSGAASGIYCWKRAPSARCEERPLIDLSEPEEDATDETCDDWTGVVDYSGRTLLMEAARLADPANLRWLLGKTSCAAVVLAVDSSGKSALQTALESSHAGNVTILCDRKGWQMSPSPLMTALNRHDGESASELLTKCPDTYELVNAPDDRGRTAFHHIAVSQDQKMLQLVAPHYDVRRDSDKAGVTSLMLAGTHAKSLDFLSAFLRLPGVRMTARDRRGRDALFHALFSGNEAAAQYLLEHMSASTTELCRDNEACSVLMLAAARGSLQLVEGILGKYEATTLVTERDNRGRSALHYAATRGHVDVVKKLVMAGSDLNSRNSWGRTPLMSAVARKHEDVARLLLDFGATTDVTDTRNRDALHLLLDSGATGAMGALMVRTKDVNRCDEHGLTPLMVACRELQSPSVVIKLLDAGADAFLQDHQQRDALDHLPLTDTYTRALLEQRGRICDRQLRALRHLSECEETDVNALTKALVKLRTLTPSLQFRIMTAHRSERFAKLVDVLACRGPAAFGNVCKAFHELGSAQVAFQLRQQAYTREPEFLV